MTPEEAKEGPCSVETYQRPWHYKVKIGNFVLAEVRGTPSPGEAERLAKKTNAAILEWLSANGWRSPQRVRDLELARDIYKEEGDKTEKLAERMARVLYEASGRCFCTKRQIEKGHRPECATPDIERVLAEWGALKSWDAIKGDGDA